MAESGKKKKGKGKSQGKKGTIPLNEFLAESPSGSPSAPFRSKSWADETDELDANDLSTQWPDDRSKTKVNLSSLPSAPRAATVPNVDTSRLPKSPPYTVFLGNLSYEANEEDISIFFERNRLTVMDNSVRLVKEKDGLMKGFGYAEFSSLADLMEALSLSGLNLKNRPLQIDVAEGRNESGRGYGGGGNFHSDESDRTIGDWRSAPRDPSPPSRGSRTWSDRSSPPRRGGGSYRDRYDDNRGRDQRYSPPRRRDSPPRRRDSPPRRRDSPPRRRDSPPRRRDSPPRRRDSPQRDSSPVRKDPPSERKPSPSGEPQKRSTDSPDGGEPLPQSNPQQEEANTGDKEMETKIRSHDDESSRDQNKDRPYGQEMDRSFGRDRDHQDRDRQYGQDRDRQYGQDRDRQYGQDRDRQYGQDRDRQYGQDRDRQYGQDRDRQYGQDRDRQYGQDRDRQYGQDRDRQYGRDRDRSYGQDRDRRYNRDGPESSFGQSWNRGGGGGGRQQYNGERYDRGGYRGGDGGRSDDYQSRSSYRDRRSPETSRDEQPGGERRKIVLQPRSKPVDTDDRDHVSAIFGGAKPVDTAKKEREVEERLIAKDRKKTDTGTGTTKVSIFGGAKPVDTSKRENEIEERIREAKGEADQRKNSEESQGKAEHNDSHPSKSGQDKSDWRNFNKDEVPSDRQSNYRPPRNEQDDQERPPRTVDADGLRRDDPDKPPKGRGTRKGDVKDSEYSVRGRGKGRGRGRGDRPKYEDPEKPDFQQANRFASLLDEDDGDSEKESAGDRPEESI